MKKSKQRSKLESKRGIVLHLGCGINRQAHAVGLDKRPLPGVDIVHDMEKIPWPLDDESVITIIAAHILEHLKPWLTVDIFNEMWRILKPDGQLAVVVPYGENTFYMQDPTHCNPFIDRTFWYFDPEHFSHLYDCYEPKPWKIEKGFPMFQTNGNLECVLRKRPLKK